MLNTQSSPTENLTQNIGLVGHKKTQLNHEKAQLNTIMSGKLLSA